MAINKFTTDTAKEIELIKQACKKYNVKATETEVWAKGGFGAEELADDVLNLINQPRRKVKFIYRDDDSIAVKTEKICKEIYGGKGVEFSPQAQEQIKDIESLGYGKLPVVIAKTQYSLSDDATKLARPTDFTVKIREVQLRSGSGFIVAVAGNIMLMPGLPQVPAANNMKISEEGVISGLF